MNIYDDSLMEVLDRKLRAEMERNADKIPYIAHDGRYETDMRQKNLSWWTNGFWAGMLWQMYHATHDPLYRRVAEKTEGWLDEAMENFLGLHHDVGFMWRLSAVADYSLTGNEKSRVRALHAATLLAGRFNLNGQYIRAWNLDKPGWMIVDCLMNLSLLYWASEETGDPRFGQIARAHADTALRVLARPDGSTNHIAVLDPDSGELLSCPAGQGYSEGSSWSRGQAWAVYGYAISAAHTGEQRYLDAARRAANYFIANVAEDGWVSRVDFRSPQTPVYLDTTATACTVCGLLALEELVTAEERPLYRRAAEKMLQALLDGHCDWDPVRDGILQNGTAAYGHEDTHMPIIYGDYFLVESLLWLRQKAFRAW